MWWRFSKQTSTSTNSYMDQQAKRKRETETKRAIRVWKEHVCVCVCIWQRFPPAPLEANGEETLQTFISEQHAELTTLMAAPVSATSLCSSPLVETHCKIAPNSHSNQSVPHIPVRRVVNITIWGQQPNFLKGLHICSPSESHHPFSLET